MVVIPAAPDGALLGSPESEAGRISNEQQHRRTFQAFAIASRETSVAEYAACVSAGGCQPAEWARPGGELNIETGRNPYYRNLGQAVSSPSQPVVGVSYEDATSYAQWLSKKTGLRYRLPSEGEWEYAARAGSAGAYWWGDAIPDGSGEPRVNCAGCLASGTKTEPMAAGGLPANPWGLKNMHGNVWEWTADFYCEFYDRGPRDNVPRLADDCEKRDAPNLRVLRGGSAYYGPDKSRSASRLRNFPDFRTTSVGFRVARDL